MDSLSGAIRHLAKGGYLNFLDAADEARLHEAYPGPTYRIRPAEPCARR